MSRDSSALLRAYIAVVRPMLEHASIVWNPSLLCRSPLGCLSSLDLLESVQRVFTHRLFWRCNLPMGLSYTEHLRFLILEPLQLRRLKFDLCMVFKMCNGLVFMRRSVRIF